ncbi:hypothetical protein ACFXI6_31355 [Streptomyces mirabilis]|uniref:hypothetical protein n=1 Tax=Streptomyces mirabilis TaxID=68239 RepID=UPI003688DCEA
MVQQRITAHKPVRVDVDGAKGSTGVLAWRIDACVGRRQPAGCVCRERLVK